MNLLKYPGLDGDTMWKQHFWKSVYNRLRIKLTPKCNTDTIITVFSEYFPLSTLPAEQEYRRAVGDFCSQFSKVEKLSPTSFVARGDIDETSKMHKKPRPIHVCHLGIRDVFDMGSLILALKDMEYKLD